MQDHMVDFNFPYSDWKPFVIRFEQGLKDGLGHMAVAFGMIVSESFGGLPGWPITAVVVLTCGVLSTLVRPSVTYRICSKLRYFASLVQQ